MYYRLLRRAGQAKWFPGMATTSGHRVVEVEGDRVAVAFPGRDYVEWLDSTDLEPDLDDPCTGLLIQYGGRHSKKKVLEVIQNHLRHNNIHLDLPELSGEWVEEGEGDFVILDKEGLWPPLIRVQASSEGWVGWWLHPPGRVAHSQPYGSVEFEYGGQEAAIEEAKAEALQSWEEMRKNHQALLETKK
jgi:hypothetical protein